MTDNGLLQFLINGVYMKKVKSKYFNQMYFFRIDSEGVFLKYHKVSKILDTEYNQKFKNIQMSNITEVRKGAQTDRFSTLYKSNQKSVMNDRCLSIIMNRGKTLDLVADSEDIRNAFFDSLLFLKNRHTKYNVIELKNLWYKEQFLHADLNNDKVLNSKEVSKLLKGLNIDVDEFYVVVLMQKEFINMEEFVELIKKIQSRKFIEELFFKYSKNKEFLSALELNDLFLKEQYEQYTLADCEQIINIFDSDTEGMLSLNGFYYLLNSDYFNLFKRQNMGVYQDMTQPITHYFINSSHNTYLEGDQFNSYSKVECYINALISGCRCVEIDVWDGIDEPVVCHGFAYTTKLLFSDVIIAINDYAFKTSCYPVIISIENHCGIEQQIKMVKIMRNIFKNKLLTELKAETCPSPSELIEKIIIKCKKNNVREALESFDDSEFDFSNVNGASKGKVSKISSELSDIVIICQSTGFVNFNHSLTHHSYKDVCSFNERKALELSNNDLKGFIKHNMSVMSRTYPSGTRLKSSNYDPMPLWMAGCQIVSLNYQTPSQPMHLNKGMFNDNGKCGYVLKPDFLRKEDKVPNFLNYFRNSKINIEVTILDGYILPKKPRDTEDSILDPYIQVKVIGISSDFAHCRTPTIMNNGFNPMWNYHMKFEIECPELAMFLFEVYDYENLGNDVLVAQQCIRFGNVANGYRMVHLNNKYGENLNSTLFVHFKTW